MYQILTKNETKKTNGKGSTTLINLSRIWFG